MRYKIIPVTPLQQNCSLVWDPNSSIGALVDPGGQCDDILNEVKRHDVTIEKILVTHPHVDHVGAVLELSQILDVPVIGPHRDDEFWIKNLPMQSELFNVPCSGRFKPQRWLENGDQVAVGQLTFDVYHCPGHTPGHIVFVEATHKLAFVGDVLFKGSIGRTDFPKGDHEALINSIKTRLWALDNEIQFVPGHGPMSTFGEEKQDNPFVGETA
ncbi:MAG: MBL fold metallo-hydrolase [Gammaproteobacteria bacterium]|nr:MBL fold metallo-hydrolase [Gammaproteobacteria bacterium]